MKTFKIITSYIILLVLLGCSSDDIENNNENQEPVFADVTIIAEDNFQIFQIDVFNSGEETATLNISAALGFSGFDLIQIEAPLATFYQVTQDNFNVFQINLETSQAFTLQGICDYGLNEFRRSPYFSSDNIGFISTQDNTNSPFNYLNTYSKSTSECTKSEVGIGNIVGSRFVDGEDLYFTIVVNNEDYILRRVNLNNPNFIEDLVLSDVFKVTVQENSIHIFHPDNLYEIYDKDTYELISSSTFDYELLSVNLGLFTAEIKNNVLYFDYPYQQPSQIANGPATIDLSQSDYINGQDEFALRVRQKLENQFEANLELTDFAFDLENDLIIYGYDIGPAGGEGGIVYTNFDADILKTVELPYVPSIILVN